MDAGAVPDVDDVPVGPLMPEWNAVMEHRQQGGLTMMQALRRQFPYAGTKHSAATLVFGPDAGIRAGDGMPAEEASVYLASDDAVENIQQAIHESLRFAGVARPPRIRVRVDFTFATEAGVREAGVPPVARMGGADFAVVEVPRIYEGEAEIVQNTREGVRNLAVRILRDFKAYVEDAMPHQKSNRTLGLLLSANIWARPVLRAGAGGRRSPMIGGRITSSTKSSSAIFKSQAALAVDGMIDGNYIVPHSLLLGRGIVLNYPDARDLRCIARAIITALDPKLESRSDSNLVIMMRDALEGANVKLLAAQRQAALPATDVIADRRKAVVASCLERVEFARSELERAIRLMQSWGRHVRLEDVKTSEQYRSRNRYKTIEHQLQLAFTNRHPLIHFENPIFMSHAPIHEGTLDALRSCVRPEAKVKIQFWGVGVEDKIGLNFPAPGATLDFLWKGGRVLNIFYAYHHASYAVDISACCNHKPLDTNPDSSRLRAGKAKDRSYCGLCGHHCSKGTIGDKWHVFEHQSKGCPQSSSLEMTQPLSPANRRQMSKKSYAALDRPRLVAFLSVGSDESFALALIARAFRRWVPYSLPVLAGHQLLTQELAAKEWEDFRLRFRGIAEAELEHVVVPCGGDVLQADKCESLDSPARRVWYAFASVHNVDSILAQLHFKSPRNATLYRALDKTAAKAKCVGCLLPVLGPSKWELQAQSAAEQETDSDVEEDDDGLLDDAMPIPFEFTSKAPVILSSSTDGHVAWAHEDCASFIGKQSNTLTIEVADVVSMAASVDVVCSRVFVESFLFNAKPPALVRTDGEIKRVSFQLAGSCGFLLTVVLRPREALMQRPSACVDVKAVVRVKAHAEEMLTWADAEFDATGLWAPSFATHISYGRSLLYRSSASVSSCGMSATSLVSKETLLSLRSMTTGGMIVLGEQAEWPPLVNPLDRSRARLYFDTTAAYPFQMIRWPLPYLEHADSVVHDFSLSLTSGLAFLDTVDLMGCDTHRFEVWGAFPPELHADLNAMPPVVQRRELFGRDLSEFQRQFMSISPETTLGERTVGHFWPVEGMIVFARTAQIWSRLGFIFSKIARVWSTPALPWGRSFAQEGERRRQAAKAAGDKEREDDIKVIYNSVVGSLNMDVSRFTTLFSEKDYVKDSVAASSKEYLTTDERYADDPRFTMRMYTAGDLVLYEMKKRRHTHTQSTLCALFIMEMARCDMLELWYGSPERAGIKRVLKSMDRDVRVVYGCTDSLILDIAGPSGSDVRADFTSRFSDIMDLSNVPAGSTFWNTLACSSTAVLRNKGRWGCIKEETGMAGLDSVIINGPNRWGARVVQSDTDTPLKYKDASKDILKSIPLVWKDAVTLEQYGASWYRADMPNPKDLPPMPEKDRVTSDLGTVQVSAIAPRKAVSVWGNQSCVVERSSPFRQWVLGSAVPEAMACVKGASW
jgi:hypothetical protein